MSLSPFLMICNTQMSHDLCNVIFSVILMGLFCFCVHG